VVSVKVILSAPVKSKVINSNADVDNVETSTASDVAKTDPVGSDDVP